MVLQSNLSSPYNLIPAKEGGQQMRIRTNVCLRGGGTLELSSLSPSSFFCPSWLLPCSFTPSMNGLPHVETGDQEEIFKKGWGVQLHMSKDIVCLPAQWSSFSQLKTNKQAFQTLFQTVLSLFAVYLVSLTSSKQFSFHPQPLNRLTELQHSCFNFHKSD